MLRIHFLSEKGEHQIQKVYHGEKFQTVCFSSCGKLVYGLTLQHELHIIEVELMHLKMKRKIRPSTWKASVVINKMFQPFPGMIIFGCQLKNYFAPARFYSLALIIMTNFTDLESSPDFYFYNLNQKYSLCGEMPVDFYFLYEKH